MFPAKMIPGFCAGVLTAFVLAATQTIAQVPTLSNVWSLALNTTSDSSAALGDDGTLYFGTFDKGLWAVDSDGNIKWKFKTRIRAGNMEIRSSPAISANGTIYFGCRDRRLYAVGPDGREKWSLRTGGWVDSSPAIGSDGTIYVGSWDKHLYAVDPGGHQKWKHATKGEITSSPAIDAQGTIYFGSHDQIFYAVKPNGARAWSFATKGAIISSPALDSSGTIIFSSSDGFLYALSNEGSLAWKLQTGGITESSPVIGVGDTIYVGVNKTIWVVRGGRQLWQREVTTDAFQQPISATPLALDDGSVCVISRYGWLTVIDQKQQSKWGAFLPYQGHASPAISPDGVIYMQESTVSALRPGERLAQSSWPKFRRDTKNTGRLP